MRRLRPRSSVGFADRRTFRGNQAVSSSAGHVLVTDVAHPVQPDAELWSIIAAWNALPAAIKAGIAAMVKAPK